MDLLAKTWLVALAAVGIATASRAGGLPGDVAWGDSVAVVRAALAGRCAVIRTAHVDPPVMPLAGQTEQHVVCERFRDGGDTVNAMAFAFADDRLVMFEARGGAVDAFGSLASGSGMDYLQFKVFDSERFVDPGNDAVWFVSEAALHPHLFTWSNPYLDEAAQPEPYNRSVAIPEPLVFGGKLETLLAGFEASCATLEVKAIDEVWLPHNPTDQTQVNCFGFEYAGFPRKIEAVFGDGTLEVVWILTAGPEEARLRRMLSAEYGKPELVNEQWEVFAGGRVALRKDIREILLISEKMVPYYASTFARN